MEEQAMSTIEIIFYPSNWLYNAGVIGLLRLLEATGYSVTNLLQSGSIIGNGICSYLKHILLLEKSGVPEFPLDKLPKWHWYYVKTSFEWKYGSFMDFVIDKLKKAKYSTDKSKPKEQSQLTKKSKEKRNKSEEKKSVKLTYEDQTIDFDDINNVINDIWEKTFAQNPQYTLDEVIAEVIKSICAKENLYIYRKAIGYLFSQDGFYQDLYNPSWFRDLNKFINLFTPDKVFSPASSSASICSFCSDSRFEVEPVNAKQMSFLFPVFSRFPNAYWQNNEKAVAQICSLCKFLIIHHHLALIRLSDKSEIFINAPSFQIMWYLNKFTREILGSASFKEMRTKRTLLAMSVIEYATKIQTSLGVWTGMNIEVVSKKDDQIEFFSLPYEVIQLLSDRRIASLLNQIGELEILNQVLDQDFSGLMEIGYCLLRLGFNSSSKQTKLKKDKLVNQKLRSEKNRRNPAEIAERIFERHQNPAKTAEQIFKLCALIEEKRK
jgi:hypothetical protein